MTTSSIATKQPEPKREYWLTQIKQWQESQLSQQAYCEKAGIKYSTFVYWRSLLLSESRPEPKPFVPVKLLPQKAESSTQQFIQMKLHHGHVVMIPCALGIKDIAQLIQLVGETHA